MKRRLRPPRIFAAWVFLVMATGSLFPAPGGWSADLPGSPSERPGSPGWQLDAGELALPGVPNVIRGWGSTGETRSGTDLLDPPSAILRDSEPADCPCRTSSGLLAQPAAYPGLDFVPPTHRPRPPPNLSVVL